MKCGFRSRKGSNIWTLFYHTFTIVQCWTKSQIIYFLSSSSSRREAGARLFQSPAWPGLVLERPKFSSIAGFLPIYRQLKLLKFTKANSSVYCSVFSSSPYEIVVDSTITITRALYGRVWSSFKQAINNRKMNPGKQTITLLRVRQA